MISSVPPRLHEGDRLTTAALENIRRALFPLIVAGQGIAIAREPGRLVVRVDRRHRGIWAKG